MPTPKGLPKQGEVWEWRHRDFNTGKDAITLFKVHHRGGGLYWSLEVEVLSLDGAKVDLPLRARERTWVDASYYFKKGEYTFIKEAQYQ